jgi:Protein of unknown function (DUF1592)/Protein of unknown function (DUF1588)/Protein of unknown function (DUF1585)
VNRKVTLGLFGTLFLTLTLFPAQNPMEIYQRALVQEQAAGNLKDAIELYERAAKDAGRDRALAARALIRAAGCYEKLGQPKAAELYAEVVRTYPEQRESVAAAQAALLIVTTGKAGKAQTVLPARLSADLQSVVVPLLDNYCVSCHTQGKNYPLPLDAVRNHLVNSSQSPAQDAEIWEKVLTRLLSRTMPPPGRPHPDVTTNAAAISLIETALDMGYPQPLLPEDRASDEELASRLSRLLWGAAPDAALLDAARRGALSDPSALGQQVHRMLSDSRSTGFVSAFMEPWLHIPDVTYAPLQPTSPTELDTELQQSFLRETRMFLESQIHEDHSTMDLWTADYTFVNERLARHYGIPNVTGSQFRKVKLSGGTRAGLLGQGSVLMLTSLYAPRDEQARISPTLRGKWISNMYLGFHPPAPPPNVPPFRDSQTGGMVNTLRQRLESHVANPSCNSCHRTFDPLGLALENFDAIGRWRDQDGGEPVDASGSFVDGTSWTTPEQFRNELLQYRDAYLSNVTQVLLSYAVGRAAHRTDGQVIPDRMLHAYEMPAVRAILRDAKASNYSWSSIIAGVARSRPFQMKMLVP